MALENYPKAQQLLDAMRLAGWEVQAAQIEAGVLDWLVLESAPRDEVPLDFGRAIDEDTVTRVVFDAMAMQLFEDVYHLQRARTALDVLGQGQFELEVAQSFGLSAGPSQIDRLVEIATEFRASLHQLIFEEPPPPTSAPAQRGVM